MDMGNEKVREARLRRLANKQGLGLAKSRKRVGDLDVNDWGGYMVFDRSNNSVECGQRFDLDLDDVEKYLTQP
jgi:hypothetical protein